MIRIIPFLLLVLVALNCSVAQTESPGRPSPLLEVRQAIDKGNAQWIVAWDKADASLIAELFAHEGVMFGSNGKLFKSPKRDSRASKAGHGGCRQRRQSNGHDG
jgi:hypothetical protein